MPTLNWAGKDKVINHHLDVPMRVLERVYTFGPGAGIPGDAGIPGSAGILPAARPEAAPPGGAGILPADSNMVIHGDNLAALKALLPRYEGRVDCVYIDPPYNTGNEGWVYNDNVNDPQIRKWLGEVVGKEGEDFSRHDKWLCMMYPRLRLLHRLLANDGAIFISIDDSEMEVIQKIVTKENVKWWHRIRERRGFCINAWRNHYPDFMVMTERGTLVIVEVKGPQLDGSDSREKCEMGKIWATQAGSDYKYFMVFLRDGDGVPGGTKIDEFLNMLEKL